MCTFDMDIYVGQPVEPVTTSIPPTDIICFGAADGVATVNVTGGTGPYTYLWSAAAGNQNTAIATGLSIGTYSVVATDFNGCTISGSETVLEPLTVLTASIINQNYF